MRPDIITAKPWLLGQPRMSALPPCGVKQTDVNRGIGAEPVGAFNGASPVTRHSFAVLFSPHNKPGLSACCLQTRLAKESRLRRG